jgi:hypothetical protein
MAQSDIEKVLAVFAGISTGDVHTATRYIDHRRFLQHNPYGPRGERESCRALGLSRDVTAACGMEEQQRDALAESSNLLFIYDSRRFPTLTTRHSAWLPRSAPVRPIPESTSQDGFEQAKCNGAEPATTKCLPSRASGTAICSVTVGGAPLCRSVDEACESVT